jgi:hypothetical protein
METWELESFNRKPTRFDFEEEEEEESSPSERPQLAQDAMLEPRDEKERFTVTYITGLR